MIGWILLLGLPVAASGFLFVVKPLRVQYWISLTVSALHLVVSYTLFMDFYRPDDIQWFQYDALSRLFLFILSHVYFWVVFVSLQFLTRPTIAREASSKKYYFSLLNLYLFANTLAVTSNHFGLYWVAAETTTLSVAPLIFYYRNDEALEAMWKYIFLVSLGIAFAFIGLLLLTLAAQGTVVAAEGLFMTLVVRSAGQLDPVWLKASFIFVFVGLSTKIGIAPMHPGDIDATSNSPSPIAGLMSASLRGTALMGVLRLYQVLVPTPAADYARLIMTIGGMLSLFVAFVFMFKVTNYKRMIAYSSVEHLGLITLGIATGGTAFVGAMMHAIYNSFTKMVLFFNAGNIHRQFRSRDVQHVFGVLRTMRWTGWFFLFGFLAVVGLPPFGLFFSEMLIFQGMVASNQYGVLIFVLFFLFLIFVGMSKTVFRMLYVESNSPVDETDETFDTTHAASLVILILLVGLGAFLPDVIYKTICEIADNFRIMP